MRTTRIWLGGALVLGLLAGWTAVAGPAPDADRGPVVGFYRLPLEAGAQQVTPALDPLPVEYGAAAQLGAEDWPGRDIVLDSDWYEVQPTTAEYLGITEQNAAAIAEVTLTSTTDEGKVFTVDAFEPCELVITGKVPEPGGTAP